MVLAIFSLGSQSQTLYSNGVTPSMANDSSNLNQYKADFSVKMKLRLVYEKHLTNQEQQIEKNKVQQAFTNHSVMRPDQTIVSMMPHLDPSLPSSYDVAIEYINLSGEAADTILQKYPDDLQTGIKTILNNNVVIKFLQKPTKQIDTLTFIPLKNEIINVKKSPPKKKSETPTSSPIPSPTSSPIPSPTPFPTSSPTPFPTSSPTPFPTSSPTLRTL
jgi:hypothetical protein